MSGQRKRAKPKKADSEVPKNSERFVEMEQTHRRLGHLYDISKLLTRFESVESTVPAVVAVLAKTLSLHSAIFIIETTRVPQTIVWQSEGASPRRLRAAKARAQDAYGYLVRSGVDLQGGEAKTIELAPSGTRTKSPETFVTLPLVVNRGKIFGALQLECAAKLDELDLVFINAAVNQLAIGLDRHSADRALRTSEAKLAGIVSTAADAIISVDESQTIVMYNEGAERIFGWSRAEAIGQPLDILVPERLRLVHRQHIRNFAVESGIARKAGHRRAEIRGLRKDGVEFPADAAISKLNIDGARLFTVIFRDVTELRRIEKEEKFLADVGAVIASTLDFQETLTRIAQLTLRDLADLCIIEFVDDQGVVRRLDVTSSDPGKTEIANALKRLPLDRSRPHVTSTILESKQPLLMSDFSLEELESVTQSEEHRRLWAMVAPTSVMGVPLIVQDRLLGALTVASCRPGRRYGATDLRLLEEVGRRAALALENARLYRQVARAVQLRDDVLAIVAHDLRSPLGTILIQASLMRRHGEEVERRTRRPAEVIERSAERMRRLIQDLLDVTRMEAGRLTVQPVRLSTAEVVSDAVEAQKLLAFSSSVDLRLDVAADVPDVWADLDRLLQGLDNLIVNAIKFTQAGGRITVGAAARDGEVLFWVTDTGMGIAPEELPHLFERFWQARKVGRQGAGLGLPIVKGIVEAHGGSIWVESTRGSGSSFFFVLPAAPSGEERHTRGRG